MVRFFFQFLSDFGGGGGKVKIIGWCPNFYVAAEILDSPLLCVIIYSRHLWTGYWNIRGCNTNEKAFYYDAYRLLANLRVLVASVAWRCTPPPPTGILTLILNIPSPPLGYSPSPLDMTYPSILDAHPL